MIVAPSPPDLTPLVAEAMRVAHARHCVPGATYRVQFHAGFTLRDATAIVPYLHSLGITQLYASPFLKARAGSTHGYDVVDHGRLNPEVGTEEELDALSSALRERGMGMLLDVVPNHVCVTSENAWWTDVLENGLSSPYAGYFDVAWSDSPRPGMEGRLLLPILADQYGIVLESGHLVPVFENGTFSLRYHDVHLPVDPRTFGLILQPATERVRVRLGADHPDAVELASIQHAVSHLPPRNEPDPQRIAEGRVECVAIRRRLGELPARFPAAAASVRDALATIAGTPGVPESFAALDGLLEAQAYRPCFWRVASDEINYRRFFDVNELAALSTEREDVFEAVHETWFRWLAAGRADGFRIDHPDGLFDPKQYLDRLQAHYLLVLARKVYDASPAAFPEVLWERDERALRERLATESGMTSHPLYVVVEKILGESESLPADWVCDGTTGYEFINAINGLFVDQAAEGPITMVYQRFTGLTEPWFDVTYHKKRLVAQSSLASELNALAYQLDRVARLDRRSRDFTLNGLRKALREVVACFPLYRSYVNGGVHDSDKAAVGKATRWAYRRNPLLGKAIFDFIRDTVLLKDSPSGPATDDYRALQRRFAGKFQQVTAPVTAKGVEDTAFYTFNRLTSLNEVGGEPGRFGWSPEQVHVFLEARTNIPGGLSPLTTHDTKRSEDVRARINVLSELHTDWDERLTRWAELNRQYKTEVEEGIVAPDANEECLLYQTLVGTWPQELTNGPEGDDARGGLTHPPVGDPSSRVNQLERETYRARIQEYVRKALAEAKVHTSWINPDSAYEEAVARFVDRILDPVVSGPFQADLSQFAARVAFFGRINSLAQTLLRCTAPGVPDVYQGTEGSMLSLVDPDNRRPVDYQVRVAWLQEIDDLVAAGKRGHCRLALHLSRNPTDPRAKLFVTAFALRCRAAHPALFAGGNYVPLRVVGVRAAHVFAFIRCTDGESAITIVPRLPVGLVPDADRVPIGRRVWGDTALVMPVEAVGWQWQNVYTGELVTVTDVHLHVAECLGVFPVALLLRVAT